MKIGDKEMEYISSGIQVRHVLKLVSNVKLKDLYKLDLNTFYMWFDVIFET